MKGYYEQKYPLSIDVRVIFSDSDAIEDSIKGLNAGHALYLARKNWDCAMAIEFLGITK